MAGQFLPQQIEGAAELPRPRRRQRIVERNDKIGLRRQPGWLLLETLLPVLSVSAFACVYRTMNAPEEYLGFAILVAVMVASAVLTFRGQSELSGALDQVTQESMPLVLASSQTQISLLSANKWLTEIYEPLQAMVPPGARGKLEPAEVFHEILQHRWFLSEERGSAVDTFEAARDYIDNVLSTKPDEALAAPGGEAEDSP